MHLKHIRNGNILKTQKIAFIQSIIYYKRVCTELCISLVLSSVYFFSFSHSTCACAVWLISIFSTVKSGFMAVASWMAWARASS